MSPFPHSQWDDFLDSNDEQVVGVLDCPPTTKIRLRWDDSTDIYGRVIVYQVRAWGDVAVD